MFSWRGERRKALAQYLPRGRGRETSPVRAGHGPGMARARWTAAGTQLADERAARARWAVAETRTALGRRVRTHARSRGGGGGLAPGEGLARWATSFRRGGRPFPGQAGGAGPSGGARSGTPGPAFFAPRPARLRRASRKGFGSTEGELGAGHEGGLPRCPHPDPHPAQWTERSG